MRIENNHWEERLIFNPDSKTPQGTRGPMSDRVYDILRGRTQARTEGWVFPSVRKTHTRGLVKKQWVAARKQVGLNQDLVLYCARHDFGTYVLKRAGI